MSIRKTAKADLADEPLRGSGGLERFVTERRFRFQPVTWNQIADDIENATDGRVRISQLTLRNWFIESSRDSSSVDDDSPPSPLGRLVS